MLVQCWLTSVLDFNFMRLIIVTFLLCVPTLIAINQTCNFLSTCPDHADCDPLTNHCVCTKGYIGNCNTEADPIGEYPQMVEMFPNDTRLFYMKPIEVQEFIEFTLTICREKDKPNVPVLLYVWDQTGTNYEYLPTNTVSPPLKISFDSQCNILTTKFVMFGVQPNGQSEMLVLGIGQNKETVTLTIDLTQKLVLGLTFYFYIVVGLIVFVSVLSLVSAIIYFVRRRRRLGFLYGSSMHGHPNNGHNIDHFEAYMPSIPALEKEGEKSDCPICLQHITKKQQIRVTPCNHIFHTPCLDAWCVQNISCPVCRSDFSLDKIGEIRQVVVVADLPKDKNYQDNWQQTIQVQLQRVEDLPKAYLKQPML